MIAVSETHLKPSQHFSIGSFIPIRKDRTERCERGVAFFINNKIEFTINDWFNKYPNLEALSVKSEVTRAPIDLVVYYNPPTKVIDKRLFEIVNTNSNTNNWRPKLPTHIFWLKDHHGLRNRTRGYILAQENLILLNNPDS